LALYLVSTLVLYRLPLRRSSRLRSLFNFTSGSYDPSTPWISRLNLEFCRTGHVTSKTVKILCRSSNPGSITLSICSLSQICQDLASEASKDQDFTTLFEIPGLSPDTSYTYSASNGAQGSVRTQRKPSDMDKFSLLSSSCIKPNWPYSPANHPLRILGFECMAAYLSAKTNIPEMMLFLGDFICEPVPG
jgi:alkaline phosphatase D